MENFASDLACTLSFQVLSTSQIKTQLFSNFNTCHWFLWTKAVLFKAGLKRQQWSKKPTLNQPNGMPYFDTL